MILIFGAATSFCGAQYTFTTVATDLLYPTAFAQDADGNFYVTSKGGTGFGPDTNANVEILDSNGIHLGWVWDFTDSVETFSEQGVLGVALDPLYDSNNYLYVFYNHKSPAKVRVVRFTISASVGTNPTIILDIDDPTSSGNHTGGNIHFRPSDPNHLYITIGERAFPMFAQQLTNPWGKILRIDKDGTIPTDNPFYDDGDPLAGNDDRIWAFGLRNTFDFTFSQANDSLYAPENGQFSLDEVNLIYPAGNYGWPDCEGTLDFNGSCATPGLLPPLETFGPVTGGLPSVTGVIMYTSNLMPEFTDHLLITTYRDGSIRDLEMGNPPSYDTVVNTETLFPGQFTGPVDILQATDGCLYILEGGYTETGKIVKMCPDELSIPESKPREFTVTPNPVHQYLSYECSEKVKHIIISDMRGRHVAYILEAKNYYVDVSGLKHGSYFIHALFEDGTREVRRFIKL